MGRGSGSHPPVPAGAVPLVLAVVAVLAVSRSWGPHQSATSRHDRVAVRLLDATTFAAAIPSAGRSAGPVGVSAAPDGFWGQGRFTTLGADDQDAGSTIFWDVHYVPDPGRRTVRIDYVVMTEQPAQRAPKTWVDVCVEGACSATNTSLSASRWTVAYVDRRVANGATVQVRVAEGRDLTARLGETWTGTMRPGVQGPVPCSLPGCDHSSADERVWLSRPTSTTASRPRPGP